MADRQLVRPSKDAAAERFVRDLSSGKDAAAEKCVLDLGSGRMMCE